MEENYYEDGVHNPPGLGGEETSRPRIWWLIIAAGILVASLFGLYLVVGGGSSPGQELVDDAAAFIAEHPASDENRSTLAQMFADSPCTVFALDVELGKVEDPNQDRYYVAYGVFGEAYETVKGEEFTLLLGATCPGDEETSTGG